MATAGLSTFLKQLTQGMAAETLNDQTDRRLVEQFLARREAAAFEPIVRRHGAMVYRVCWRILGQRQDAEDAFQATFLLLAQKLRTVRNRDSLASWLHGVAHRVALQAKGRAASRRRHEERAAMTQVAPPADLVAADLSAAELLAVLDAELGKLPDKWRLPLILCYLEGRTQEESAGQLRWSKSTLRRRLDEAREALGSRLKRRGLVWSQGLAAVLLSDCLARAALPPGLVSSTVAAATLVTAGGAATSAVSPKVAALTEGVVKAMFLKKLKTAMAVLLALGLIGLGGGLLAFQTVSAYHGPTGNSSHDSQGATAGTNADMQESDLKKTTSPLPVHGDKAMPTRSLSGHINRLTWVAYSPDGTAIATASWDGSARIWDAKTGKETLRLGLDESRLQPGEPRANTFHQIAFSPDSAFVVTVMRETTDKFIVIVWNRRTGEKVRTSPADGATFAISAGGLIACGGYQAIHLYELATGKLVREIQGDEKQLSMETLTFSPDGKTLISTGHPPTPQRGDGISRLTIMPDVMRSWDVTTGKERPSALNGLVIGRLGQRIALSPDGRTVVHANRHLAGDRYEITLREVATGGERIRLIGHASEPCDYTFSPDGRTLASGGMDGTVRLWDVLSGKELGCFGALVDPFKGGWVLSVAFSPDGRTLVSGGLDMTAQVWDVSRITERRGQETRAERGPETRAERDVADFEADWKDLAGDPAVAYAALGRLVLSPKQAVAFLGGQLQNEKPPDAKRIARLIADLDNATFSVRDQATKDLLALGDTALPALQKATTSSSTLEMKRRLEALIDQLDVGILSAGTVRHIRAVESLEAIATPEARQVLDQVAAGPSGMRLTAEARASADRLAKRRSMRP